MSHDWIFILAILRQQVWNAEGRRNTGLCLSLALEIMGWARFVSTIVEMICFC
jgi:hypothetical protein